MKVMIIMIVMVAAKTARRAEEKLSGPTGETH